MGANGNDVVAAAAAGESPMGAARVVAEGGATVFRGADYSLPRTTVALALWLGGIRGEVGV